MTNSPYCLPYNLYDASLKNLELDQPVVPQLIFFFTLITCLLDIVLIIKGEILSLVGLKGLMIFCTAPMAWYSKSSVTFHAVDVCVVCSLLQR